MTYNSMAHVGIEAPVDLAILSQMSTKRHFGWHWKGSESCTVCELAPCGLVVVPERDCPIHQHKGMGAAKQVHWAKDCPGE